MKAITGTQTVALTRKGSGASRIVNMLKRCELEIKTSVFVSVLSNNVVYFKAGFL